MEYVLLVVTGLVAGMRSILTKTVNKGANSSKMVKTNLAVFCIAFLAIMLIGIQAIPTMFKVPWWLTIVYAVCMVMAQFCLMKAVEFGPVSVSYLIYSCGLIITLLFGGLYYREKVNTFHVIGVAFILASFCGSLKKENQKINPLWIVAALGCFCCSGLLGVWQKVLSYEYPECKLDNFMQVSFLFMIAFSGLLVLVFGRERKGKQKENIEETEETQKTLKTADVKRKWLQIGFVVALGVCMAVINKTNTYLAGALPAVVVFPCTGCGAIISSSIFAMLIFKEMPSRLQKLSILAGIIGIIFIGVGAAL